MSGFTEGIRAWGGNWFRWRALLVAIGVALSPVLAACGDGFCLTDVCLTPPIDSDPNPNPNGTFPPGDTRTPRPDFSPTPTRTVTPTRTTTSTPTFTNTPTATSTATATFTLTPTSTPTVPVRAVVGDSDVVLAEGTTDETVPDVANFAVDEIGQTVFYFNSVGLYRRSWAGAGEASPTRILPIRGVSANENDEFILRRPIKLIFAVNNVYVLDHDRIRRVIVDQNRAVLVAGGGTQTGNNVPSTSLLLAPVGSTRREKASTLFAADRTETQLYVRTGNESGFRIIDLAGGTARQVTLAGGGALGACPTLQLSVEPLDYALGLHGCGASAPRSFAYRFGPPPTVADAPQPVAESTTNNAGDAFFFTGGDGLRYAMSRRWRYISRYQRPTGTWQRIVGFQGESSAANSCDDNIAAGSCLTDIRAATVAVATLYFLDGNQLRYVDGNTIRTRFTLSLGIGEGQPARRSRVARLGNFAFTVNNELVFLDQDERRIRMVQTNGNLTTLAGDGRIGQNDLSGAPTEQGLADEGGSSAFTSFGLDNSLSKLLAVIEVNGDKVVGSLVSGTNSRWSAHVGGGNLPWQSGDNAKGTDINFGDDRVRILGASFGQLLLGIQNVSGTVGEMKLYTSPSPFNQRPYIGSGAIGAGDPQTGFSANGSPAQNSTVPPLNPSSMLTTFDQSLSFLTLGDDKRTVFDEDQGTLRVVGMLPSRARAFTRVTAVRYVYCGEDGLVWNYNTISGVQAITQLPWVTCRGPSIAVLGSQLYFLGNRNGREGLFNVNLPP